MTVPEHYRLVFGGQLGNAAQPVESWSCSLSFDPGQLVQTTSLGGPALADLAGDVTDYLTNSDMQLSNLVTLEYIKMNHIGTNGRYTEDFSNTHLIDPVVRGTASGTWPFQDSLVVSLQGAGRGPGNRGRFYLPPQGGIGGVGPDGTISNGFQTNVLAATKTFIQNLNNWPGLDIGAPQVCIASKTGLHTVSSVRIGAVMDTQRRRRRSLPERYLTASVA